jgi:hypothetical protein
LYNQLLRKPKPTTNPWMIHKPRDSKSRSRNKIDGYQLPMVRCQFTFHLCPFSARFDLPYLDAYRTSAMLPLASLLHSSHQSSNHTSFFSCLAPATVLPFPCSSSIRIGRRAACQPPCPPHPLLPHCRPTSARPLRAHPITRTLMLTFATLLQSRES